MFASLINVRSLVNKMSHLHSFILSSDYYIYCLTETWLSDHFYDDEIFPAGHTIFHKDREGTQEVEVYSLQLKVKYFAQN